MQTAEQYRTEKPYAFKYLHVEVVVRLLVHLEVFNPLVERPPDAEVVVVEEEDDKNEIQAGVIRYFEESRGRNHSRRRTSRSSSCWSRRCSTSDGVWTWSSQWDCSSLPFRRLPAFTVIIIRWRRLQFLHCRFSVDNHCILDCAMVKYMNCNSVSLVCVQRYCFLCSRHFLETTNMPMYTPPNDEFVP